MGLGCLGAYLSFVTLMRNLEALTSLSPHGLIGLLFGQEVSSAQLWRKQPPFCLVLPLWLTPSSSLLPGCLQQLAVLSGCLSHPIITASLVFSQSFPE